MRLFLRIFLLLLAVFGVSGLGYYAYVLGTDTLSIPFVGQEKQTGNILRFVLAKPNFLAGSYSDSVIDSSALLRSTFVNERSYVPSASGESVFMVSGEYVEISHFGASGDVLRIDADRYNTIKKTRFRLPRDFELTLRSDIQRYISIFPVGEPRSRQYHAEMSGFQDLSTEDIRWYIHHDTTKNCQIQDAWNSLTFEEIPHTEVTAQKVGTIESALYTLDYSLDASRTCIIAGVGGEFVTVQDYTLPEFSLTGTTADILSPEYDMKSRIDISFSEAIFMDSGALYSPEYIAHRKDQKIQFLKSLNITPALNITEDDIILTPTQASIIAPFEEGKSYSVRLDNIQDIYGRTANMRMNFLPTRSPFLSLGITENKTIFRLGEPLPAKIYSLDAPKNEYDLKLCRITLDGYARMERIIAEKKIEYTDTVYTILSSPETSNCVKKSVVIASGATVSPFDIRELQPGLQLDPGLYVLAFRNKDDITGFDRFVSPRVFAVIDSHITMKVDAGGQMSFLVTDIQTGRPRENQGLIVSQNIARTYTQDWNPKTETYETNYLPLSPISFSTGVDIGRTDSRGFFATKKQSILEGDYSSPYSLMHEAYSDYEGRYSSFLATSSDGTHFGYVVSTWNDGITGWNFGLKESDYSWATKNEFSVYMHTDRRLYLPGERVYVHAIVRKNTALLEIPTGEKFDISVTDPSGREIKKVTQVPNEFGTLSFDFDLPQSSPLGSYSISLTRTGDMSTFISNSYINFQVEIFKNPTFTANVTLRSPDVEDGVIKNLRKIENQDTSMPWYSSVYQSQFALEGIVKAQYYNGAQMKSIPFTYRIYRNIHYSDEFWSDCFWGCYYEPAPEFYTEGTGSIDQDGFGFFRVPVDFSSFSDDYIYTAEVTLTDPMTGEQVVTPSTLLVSIPETYKVYGYDNPLVFIPEKRILKPGEAITGKLDPTFGKWNASHTKQYRYELVHRRFETTYVDDIRLIRIPVSLTFNDLKKSGDITGESFSLATDGLEGGEYYLRILPKTEEGVTPPESSISETMISIVAPDTVTRPYTSLRVLPEKTVYHLGETARVMFTLPFTGGTLYLTRERGGIIDYEYLTFTGNTFIREYPIDELAVPNLYIGAVAFEKNPAKNKRSYAVGYGEIVTDLNDKKGLVQVSTNKATYTNRDQVEGEILFTDRNGKPQEGEVTLMVVDESLIRLLGNIDLDVLPKFYQKFPFTMKTALTAIGIEKNLYLSRRGSNGGSGDKGGGGVEIASRSLFRNTAYYNPSIRTDASGRAKFSFTLPDNVTDYRIIAIAQTKKSLFAVSEKTIPVRRDYTLETHVPSIAYQGDNFEITASAFNSTKRITQTVVRFTLGTGTGLVEQEKSLILGASESKSVSLGVKVPPVWKGKIPYTVTLLENGKTLDSISRDIEILDPPIIEATYRSFGVLSGTSTSIALRDMQNIDGDTSTVSVRLSHSLLLDPAGLIKQLIQYPYGCIEQTISSTLPNALALQYARVFSSSIDRPTAEKNLKEGLDKIYRMQTYGGWKYWETDSVSHPYVTPYVVRSLYAFRDLGVNVPESIIESGLQNIVDMMIYQTQGVTNDIDFRAEVFFTLARARHEYALEVQKSIDPAKLSLHGRLAFAYGLQYLGKLPDQEVKNLITLFDTTKNNANYWYWSESADQALLAQLLLDRGDMTTATRILDRLLRERDITSYYISTQERIQILIALLKHAQKSELTSSLPMALRSGTMIADVSLSSETPSQNISLTRKKLGKTIDITRENPEQTIFYEVIEKNRPQNILGTQPNSATGIRIQRRFELVDISKGIDADGKYIAVSPLTSNTLKKGELYKVTLDVDLTGYDNRSWYYLTLEDFMPGAWRPIRGIFKTESIFTSDTPVYGEDSWSHVEARSDRILATSQYGYGNHRTYSYYIRPEYKGTFLLPPVTAYFMYRPEVFAYGVYEQIFVE